VGLKNCMLIKSYLIHNYGLKEKEAIFPSADGANPVGLFTEFNAPLTENSEKRLNGMNGKYGSMLRRNESWDNLLFSGDFHVHSHDVTSSSISKPNPVVNPIAETRTETLYPPYYAGVFNLRGNGTNVRAAEVPYTPGSNVSKVWDKVTAEFNATCSSVPSSNASTNVGKYSRVESPANNHGHTYSSKELNKTVIDLNPLDGLYSTCSNNLCNQNANSSPISSINGSNNANLTVNKPSGVQNAANNSKWANNGKKNKKDIVSE